VTAVDSLASGVDALCGLLGKLPIEALHYPFMQRATVAVLLLAPLCAVIGIQVVNFRLAFFADAVSHSAFTGMGLGMVGALLLGTAGLADRSLQYGQAMMFSFGLFVALAITYQRRRSGLSSDTIIGVFSSSAVALGLVLFSVRRLAAGQDAFIKFLQGSVMYVTAEDLLLLGGFFLAAMAFVAYAYNRLLLVGLNSDLAQVLKVNVPRYEYAFAAFLSLLVMFCIPIVGALVVTAFLVIPAAAARNFATNAGAVFWWAVGIALSSGLLGLYFADRYDSPVGATIVLCNTVWFAVSQIFYAVVRNRVSG
jgi:zinc transport system permease protein